MPRWTALLPRSLRTGVRRILDPLMDSLGYIRFDAHRFYAEDGLFTVHNDSFRSEKSFQEAYGRGIAASHGVDPRFSWRVNIALWAATTALRAPGYYVECGVNAGFMSSAIMRRLNWSTMPRTFYLVDTFAGPVFEQYSKEELQLGRADLARDLLSRGAYVTDVERARTNFSEWPNAIVVPGAVPDVLPSVAADRVAFLHIDMNCAFPECAALEYFWPLLSPGAIVLFDDYANHEFRYQKEELDHTLAKLAAQILPLPTGQGLIVR